MRDLELWCNKVKTHRPGRNKFGRLEMGCVGKKQVVGSMGVGTECKVQRSMLAREHPLEKVH